MATIAEGYENYTFSSFHQDYDSYDKLVQRFIADLNKTGEALIKEKVKIHLQNNHVSEIKVPIINLKK